jgi:hypothetical protein
VLVLFAVVAVTVIGFVSMRRERRENEKTVFICKACGNAWAEVDRNVRVKGELPKFRILRFCPTCRRELLDEETSTIRDGEPKTQMDDQQHSNQKQ